MLISTLSDVSGTDEAGGRKKRRRTVWPEHACSGHMVKSHMTVILLDGELLKEG